MGISLPLGDPHKISLGTLHLAFMAELRTLRAFALGSLHLHDDALLHG
jgi:hypothetical protein